MILESKKRLTRIVPYFKKLFFRNGTQSHVGRIQSKKKVPLSPEKKAELEKLCDQLFKKKKLITSGKFQFIGLAKIKKRMGRQWSGLCKIVYDVAEDVIDQHIGQSDISIRYKDDTYVIIFAHASLEEGTAIAVAIAQDIQKRLFELEEDELKGIEIRKALHEIRTDFLIDQGFPDFLDALAVDWEDSTLHEEPQKTEAPVEIKITDVGAENYKPESRADYKDVALPENIFFSYLPLWDVPRNALTTYLCLPRAVKSDNELLEAHKKFYQTLSADQKVSLDIKTLQHVMDELTAMEKDGRKLLIACPVHYETVYHFDNYELYKQLLEKIPEAQKQFVIFVIINMSQDGLPKNPYWFAAPLRAFCRHVFAEVPLRRDINFNYLRNSGVDVVGVRLDDSMKSEQEIINILNSFSAKAKALKIPKTFVLGISSLSLTTSAVCAGFDFLGGQAIHDAVGKPNTIHKYRHEDLIISLTAKQ